MSTLRLAVVGMGRMGRAIAALAVEHQFDVVAAVDAAAARAGITREALGGADVAIEFTTPAAAPGNVRAVLDAGCPVVVGTTGWYEALPAIRAHVTARGGALLWAPNFSIGVNLFQQLVAHAASLFATAPGFDAHLVEMHHRAKRDAPSGTAIALQRLAEGELGRALPVTSIRTGSVPGTHELILDAPFETVRLVHVARDRRAFAEGALVAARWLHGRQGVFEMKDVLAPSSTTQRSP